MAVSRKPPGQAVDRRNGERTDLPAVRLAKFSLPKRDDGRIYDPQVRRMWSSLWDDQVSTALTVADRQLLIRWAMSVDDWLKARARGWEDPITAGRNDQPVASPWFAIAKDAMAIVVDCEKQIGIGSLNRARLNIAVGEAALTLDDVNARLSRPADQPGRPDPRIIPGVVEQ